MADKFYEFPCGCKFEIAGPPVFPKGDLPSIIVDWDNINLDCKATWRLISTGKTKMLFQIEKGGGRNGARKLKPEHIEHIAGLGAVLRPGCAQVLDKDGISTTEHYYRRKNGEEEVKPYHPAVDPILASTYNLMLYQEQAMKIAEVVAAFNKKKADDLRRAAGKKKADDMAKVKKDFIEGVKTAGVVSEKMGDELFSWIRESQRYSFNKCVCPSTLVETPDGFKLLEEVNIGDKVNSPYGFLDVVNIYQNGKKELYEVVLESGKNIKCTIDHKFLCDDDEIHPLWEIIELDLKIICEEE